MPRPRVEALLARAWSRRLTLLIAGGGFGKTTALLGLADLGPVRWVGLRPVDREIELLAARLAEALGLGALPGLAAPAAAIGADDRRGLAEGQAALLCEALAERDEEILLVIDDLEQLSDDDSAGQLVRALCLQAPSQLHIVLSGRRLPAIGVGHASRAGGVLEIAAPDLAFTLEETVALLTARLGVAEAALAEKCRSLTGGWPAALQLTADRLERLAPAQRLPTLERTALFGGQLWREFVADLLEREAPEARLTLAVAAVAPVVDARLLAALAIDRAAAVLEGLQTRGLLVATDDGDGRTMSPILAEVVAESLPANDGAALRAQAAAWLESQDRIGEALECLLAGPAADVRALVERRGHTLVARGYGARVAEILTSIGTATTPTLDSILGEALQSFGHWDRAIEIFRRVQQGAAGGALAPGIAWRFGALLYQRGESETALEVLSAAHQAGDHTSDSALVSAWLSSTQWSRGEPRRAAETASIARRQAQASGDPAALAAAHVACALAAASSGDRERNERHYRAALAAATEAGDSNQLARIHANLSSRALEEGDYAGAIAEADTALQVGAGHAFYAALATCNKGEALMSLGELDDAHAAFVEALAVYSDLGSLMASWPETMLGVLYRERGDLTRARLAFERGERLAERSEDAHTLVFAHCGLARTLAGDDPSRGRAHARKAIELASSLERAQALCAAAWVELCAGDREAAAAMAGDAESEARATGDRPSLADALALRGIASRPPDGHLLTVAVELWAAIGNVIAQRRALLVLANCRGDAAAATELRQELAARGVVADLDPSWAPALSEPGTGGVAIATLGRFAVLRDRERVTPSEWQSRKARDLLKLLVARQGRPITRDAAAEALWPGEPAAPLSNRLSVALSTLRRVLDPARSHPPDHFVTADRRTLALRVDRVTVDVIEFLRTANDAFALEADGDAGRAERLLREAEKLYTGDFLEEDLYEDWAVDCRETARAGALQVSRLLARAAARRGDDETACRHLRRLLEGDPYDEDAWIALIAAQSRLRRYGEARRQHAIYARRMAELEVEPVALADAVRHDDGSALRPR